MPPFLPLPDLPDALTPLVESGRPWLEQHGLWLVAAGLFSETLLFTGAFVPGFALLVAAGFLVARGVLPLVPVLLLAWAGALAGDAASYGLGRAFGSRLLGRRAQWGERLKVALEREGPSLLLWYHYAPTLRAVLPCIAGSSRYPMRRWFVFDSLGVMLWVALILGLGWMAGGASKANGNIVFSLVNTTVVALTLWALWRIGRNLRRYEADANSELAIAQPQPREATL